MNKRAILASITDRYRDKLREKAIDKAKARIALSNRYISDLSAEELEDIVSEEEDKLIDEIKTFSIGGLLLFLGVSW